MTLRYNPQMTILTSDDHIDPNVRHSDPNVRHSDPKSHPISQLWESLGVAYIASVPVPGCSRVGTRVGYTGVLPA